MKNFLFIFLLFSQLLFARDIVVLDSLGYGKTPNEAKQNALQELVFKLKASVDTSLNISTQVAQDKLTENSSSSINISAKSFFEGLIYDDVIKKDDFYQTKALLTQKALKKTLLTLNEDILTPIKNLSKKEQKNNLEKISTFFALYKYKPNDETLPSISLARIKQQQQNLYKAINMAKIIFKTNVTNAKITIANKTYAPNKPFYIENGNYQYSISKNGYVEENGKFFAQAGHTKTITKELIEVNQQNIHIYIHTSSNEYNIKDDVASVLSNYNVQTTSNAYSNNAFDFHFSKEFLFSAGSTTFYKFSLTLKAYKNNQVVLTKKATLKRVADSKLKLKASKLAKALTKATLKKLNLQKFSSNKKVNYNTLLPL